MDQDLKEYLDSQFAELRQDTAELRQNTAELRQNTAELRRDSDRRFDEADRQFAELRDEVHQTRILVEKLDDKIDLVAEGVTANTEVMHQLHEENRQELRDFRSVMKDSHRHLERRVSRHDDELKELTRRVTLLEVATA